VIPTEHEGTVALDAAARLYLETQVPGEKWDNLDAVQRQAVKQMLLPMVWAALEALPDRRHSAWAEGFKAGGPMHDVDLNDPDAHTRNPYPAEEL